MVGQRVFSLSIKLVRTEGQGIAARTQVCWLTGRAATAHSGRATEQSGH